MRERLSERAKTSDRVDDNPESVLKRLRTFSVENSKVEEHLQETGVLTKVSKLR